MLKGDEPELFSGWTKHNSNVAWNDFAGPSLPHINIYRELRQTLVAQQDKMCCYCEIALCSDVDAHVEHFKDRDHHNTDIYMFDNLLASCQYTDSCGHKKGNGYFNNM